MDVEFQNTDGDFIHNNFFKDNMDTPANRRFMEEQREEHKRIVNQFYEKEAKEFDEWAAKRAAAIKEFEENTGLPVECLLADQLIEEEHY